VNFTLHFQLARLELGSSAAGVGAMLPDVWRMADRHVRPARGSVGEERSGDLAEVLAGVAHHTRADASFHASDVFRRGERELCVALAAVGAPKMPLFAHIAWELCLDGALVRREGTSLGQMVSAAIAGLSDRTQGEPPLLAAARLHHAARKGEPLPVPFRARVERLLGEISRGTWIDGYARPPDVTDRLGGIRSRLGFAPLTDGERAALAGVVEGALRRADDALDAVLALSGA
jgi:hypothetical protein